MGFENIIESFNQTKKSAYHLSQGGSLKKRAEALQNLISIGREGFDSARLNSIDKNEKNHLKNLEGKYNKLVSDYANSYKSFLQEHQTLQGQVMKCKSKCLETHNRATSDYSNKRLACQAGCDLKAPYISSCKDTYLGLKSDSSKNCAILTKGKCDGGDVTLGQNKFVNSSSNIDKKSNTLKDGCCDCGGGTGGKPKGIVNKTPVSSCNDLANAFGITAASSSNENYKSACNQAGAGTIDVSRTKDFYKEFNKIQDKNLKISNAAEKLYGNIDKLHNIRVKLDNNINNEETKLKNTLSKFENTHSKLQSMSGRDPNTGRSKPMNPTFDAQQEDKRLQQKSEEMKFYFWSILAIVLAVSTMINFNRRIQ